MFIRFLLITLLTAVSLHACRNAETDAKAHEATRGTHSCSPLQLVPTRRSLDHAVATVENAQALPLVTHNFVDTLTRLAKTTAWEPEDYMRLRRSCLDLIQTATISHFLDVGRHIAYWALSDLLPQSPRTQASDRLLTPHEARQLFSKLTSHPLPKTSIGSGESYLLKYVMLLSGWTKLLEDRIQLRPWLNSVELRWMLEARVLGHFGAELEPRWRANQQLSVATDYAFTWNTEVLSIWQGKITSSIELKALPKRYSMPCLHRLIRVKKHE